jgi:uncharacterized protein YprB with RNaseH-like and TPR domain
VIKVNEQNKLVMDTETYTHFFNIYLEHKEELKNKVTYNKYDVMNSLILRNIVANTEIKENENEY